MSASVTAHMKGIASTTIGKMATKKEKVLSNERERVNATNASKTPTKNFFTYPIPFQLYKITYSLRFSYWGTKEINN